MRKSEIGRREADFASRMLSSMSVLLVSHFKPEFSCRICDFDLVSYFGFSISNFFKGVR